MKQWSASILLGTVLPLAGSCPLGWGTALVTVTTSSVTQESVFLFPFASFRERNLYSFFEGMVSYFDVLLNMLVAKREPTPCYRDAFSVDTPKWAFWVKGWLNHVFTLVWTFFLGWQKDSFFFWREF